MSNRPAKRRRTDTNRFMDLEAITDDVLEDDELTDGEEELEDEMDEEETRWDSVGTSTEDARFQSEYATADYTLFKDDNLWEIWMQAFHPTTPQSLARSVMANPSRPGRIYAEVSTHQQAMRLATSEWAQTRIVRSLNISRQSWGRVRGKRKGWEHYRGDVGLVESVEGKMVLLLVPRIRFSSPEDRLSRPTQALSLKEMVESTFGEETVGDAVGRIV
ncbi:hypothetical protein BDZ97DRAFT_1768393 [Flammula alnicola]|nr:hypothetical protein BDZ97DRAFT_1768393 [Flammula alnicola]